MKGGLLVFVAVIASARAGYGTLDEEMFTQDIVPFARARFVRQGYGSAGGASRPVVAISPPAPQGYGSNYGSGGSAYGQGGGPVSFGGGQGGYGNQGFNKPVSAGYGGGAPLRNPHQLGGGAGYGNTQNQFGGGYATGPGPVSKPIGGYGGGQSAFKPQTGGPGYGSPAPVVQNYGPTQGGFGGPGGPGGFQTQGGDSYSAPPVVQSGFGVPQKPPSASGPVGYGR